MKEVFIKSLMDFNRNLIQMFSNKNFQHAENRLSENNRGDFFYENNKWVNKKVKQ